jgi:hypothetical protein
LHKLFGSDVDKGNHRNYTAACEELKQMTRSGNAQVAQIDTYLSDHSNNDNPKLKEKMQGPFLGLHTVPYTDGYTVPSDGYGTRTVTTLSLGLTVRCMVWIYPVLTVKRWLSQPCIRLYSANEYIESQI